MNNNPFTPLLAHIKQGTPLTTEEVQECIKEMRDYNYTLLRIVLFLTISAIPLGLIKQISHHPFAHIAFYLHVFFLYCFVLWSLASIWHANFFEEFQLMNEEQTKKLNKSPLLEAIAKAGRTPYKLEKYWLQQ